MGGGPKPKKVEAEAGDELEEDAFGMAVPAGDEVALDLFASFFVCSERARLSFLRCILANEFRMVNASAT